MNDPSGAAAKSSAIDDHLRAWQLKAADQRHRGGGLAFWTSFDFHGDSCGHAQKSNLLARWKLEEIEDSLDGVAKYIHESIEISLVHAIAFDITECRQVAYYLPVVMDIGRTLHAERSGKRRDRTACGYSARDH